MLKTWVELKANVKMCHVALRCRYAFTNMCLCSVYICMREWIDPRGRYGGGNTINLHFFFVCLNVSLMKCNIHVHVSDLKNNHILEAENSFLNHIEMNVKAFTLRQ